MKSENIATVALNRPNLDDFFTDNNGHLVQNKGVIKECRVCVRPGNETLLPKVYLDIGSKLIVNNYGHAGIGYTTLFGSVNMAVGLFLKQNVNKSDKIVVVGAGCIGLYTALAVHNEGYKNVEIIAEELNDIPSYNSGAIYSAASMLSDVDESRKKYADDIFIGTWNVSKSIIEDKFWIKTKGINYMDAYFGDEEEVGTVKTKSGMEFLVEKGIIPQPETLYVKFGKSVNRMKKYKSIYYNTFEVMKSFHDLVKEVGIKLTVKKVTDFKDVPANYIFNCTGVGSKELKNDTDILPICGHIIHFKNQDLSKLNYYIYTRYIPPEDKGKFTHSTAPLMHFMPKFDGKEITGIAGGTFFRNYRGEDNQLNQREWLKVLDRVREFYGYSNEKEASEKRPKF